MLTSAEQALLRRYVTVTGDGNVVGDGNTVIRQRGDRYDIQLGEQRFTVTVQDLRRVLNVENSQVGVIGDGNTVYGGIHFHAPLSEEKAPPLDREAALAQYREGVLRRHGTTRIFGQPEAVAVEGIFTHLNILERPQAWERDPRRTRERVEGLAYVTEAGHDRLMILGKPGAGKTTFLRYLACQAARGEIDRVPVLIELPAWAMRGGTLLEALTHEFAVCGVADAEPLLRKLLAAGHLLLLFDALDEVPEAARPRLLTGLRDAGDQYPRCQVLITCRTAATEVLFERFQYVEITDFNKAQVETFIGKWFQHNAAQGQTLWDTLNEEKTQGMLDLAQTPLLLTLFCIVFAELGALPARRAELYREALDVLVKRWNRSKALPPESAALNLSPARTHALFAHIAYHTFTKDEVTFLQERAETLIGDYLRTLPGTPALLDIDLEDVLHELEAQHGILVQTAQRVYTFAHLTFQEYYAARHIVDNAASGTLPKLPPYAHEDRWREVILITASLLDNADVFFAHFLDALAAIVAPHTWLVAFLTWVARKAGAVDAPYRPAAIRSFYSYLARARDRDLDCDLDRARALARALDRDLALALAFARDLDFVLDRVLDRALALDFVLARARARARARAHALARALDCALDRTLDLARARASASDHASARDLAHDLARVRARVRASDDDRVRDHARALDHARTLSLALNLPALANALATLNLPITDDPPAVWATFADNLQALMIEHRDIGHDWDFTLEQAQGLGRYFEATHLLVECLDVATVTDREAILDRLLLPPEPDNAITQLSD
jgi:predicted NACHT family NTPase